MPSSSFTYGTSTSNGTGFVLTVNSGKPDAILNASPQVIDRLKSSNRGQLSLSLLTQSAGIHFILHLNL